MAMVAAVTAISLLAFVRPAAADVGDGTVLNGDATCTTQSDGTRDCGGLSAAFDGVPIDVNVSLPAGAPPAGGFPIVGVFHGWGGSKIGFDSLHHWTDQGYAAFSMSDRGWGASCGGPGPPVTQGQTCVQSG